MHRFSGHRFDRRCSNKDLIGLKVGGQLEELLLGLLYAISKNSVRGFSLCLVELEWLSLR